MIIHCVQKTKYVSTTHENLLESEIRNGNIDFSIGPPATF